MYCKNCGKETKSKTGFCRDCKKENIIEEENKTEKSKSNKVMSIVGFILSFIIPVAGLIFSIISLNTGRKNLKKTGEKNRYIGFNIAGIIISVIIFIIQVFVILIFFIALIVNHYDDPLYGKWKCASSTYLLNLDPLIEVDFDVDKTFEWAKYGDSIDNRVEGTYSFSKSDNKNYKINLLTNKYIVDGELSDHEIENLNGKIYMDSNDKSMILQFSQKKYYCQKAND